MKNNWIIILEFSFVWRLTKIQIFCTLKLNNNFSILLQNDELITSLLIIFVLVRFGCPCPPAWLCVVGVDWGGIRHLEDVILLYKTTTSEKTKAFYIFIYFCYLRRIFSIFDWEFITTMHSESCLSILSGLFMVFYWVIVKILCRTISPS